MLTVLILLAYVFLYYVVISFFSFVFCILDPTIRETKATKTKIFNLVLFWPVSLINEILK